MVERPIKKSERQIAPPSNAGEETQETQANAIENSLEATQETETQSNAVEDSLEATTAPEKRKVIPSIPGKEKAQGRGKSSNREEAVIPPTNLALMRGPKPTKPKPPVAVAPVEEVESGEPEGELEADSQE